MPWLANRRRPLLIAVVGSLVVGILTILAWPSSGAASSASPTATTASTTTTSTSTTTTLAPPPTEPPTTEAAPPDTEPPPTTVARVAHRAPVTAPPATDPPPPPPPPEPAGPTPAPDQAARSLALLNSWRQQNGLAPLAYAGDAASKAQAHAEEMAAAGKLWHTNLRSGVDPSWTTWAENVGYGGSADQVHQMFMASSGHNANMLSPNMTHVGVGAAIAADGTVYICQEFVG